MIGWLTDVQVNDQLHPDSIDDADTLALLNATAIDQLEAYAPADGTLESTGWVETPPGSGLFLPPSEGVSTLQIPERYKLAQVMQVRNLWNAGRVSPSGDVGDEGFQLTVFPLDWQVKAIIRPKRAVPVVG